jgi:hypothetical protein
VHFVEVTAAARPAAPGDWRRREILVVERWLVLYRIGDAGVQVVRIVDGARDLTKLKWTPE